MPHSEPLIDVQSLTKRFGNFTALRSVSLSIHHGEVFGLLGPNGAGKSTLIRTLLGFLTPSEGTAKINGYDCTRQRVDVHRFVSYLPGDARLYRMMRGRNVLRLYCEFRETADLDRAMAIAEKFELNLNHWVGLMSTGMRQKLALAVVLAAKVPLLILDEPTANLDPTVRGQVIKTVLEEKSKGTAVVFSSHVLSEIEDCCDRVGILRSGELVHVESMSELNRLHRIRARLVDSVMPKLPTGLASAIELKQDGDQIQLETQGDLSPVLRWLADTSFADIQIQPVGLRAVYDRFHYPDTIVSKTETNA